MTKEFETSDFALICYLNHLKLPILRIEEEGPKRKKFYYEDTPQLRLEIDAFYNGLARVEPRGYFLSIKSTKSRIYNS